LNVRGTIITIRGLELKKVRVIPFVDQQSRILVRVSSLEGSKTDDGKVRDEVRVLLFEVLALVRNCFGHNLVKHILLGCAASW